jgi:hypothetical protein
MITSDFRINIRVDFIFSHIYLRTETVSFNEHTELKRKTIRLCAYY